MMQRPYKTKNDHPKTLAEPAVAYQPANAKAASAADGWNPNIPINATQEEFLEHIHKIEEGDFTSWEEAKKEFEAWEKEYLASKGISVPQADNGVHFCGTEENLWERICNENGELDFRTRYEIWELEYRASLLK